MIWRPDLLVYNNANMNVHESEMMTNALVQHDGRVSLFRAVHRFPFDQQICYLMLASWSYDGSQVMVRPAGDDQTNQSAGLNRNSQMNLSSHHHQSSSSFSSSSNSGQNNYFMKSASLTHYIPNMEWSWVLIIIF
ncbi:unnamed protein product [Meloidogyne enterolobii]|uniref:Uncharacterized protein n=1 Tax=Meloidogyne enterolobii TaxID=390850 RepID=A0ACB1A6G4_MELEN